MHGRLDADSIMTGSVLVTLARVMEAHPEIGILQSLPLPAGRETLFGRLIQFGARLQSPMLASGLAFWQLGRQLLGHNASCAAALRTSRTLPHSVRNPPWVEQFWP